MISANSSSWKASEKSVDEKKQGEDAFIQNTHREKVRMFLPFVNKPQKGYNTALMGEWRKANLK